MSSNQSIILGIGNEILKDDGIGPQLVKDLQQHEPIGNVEYKTAFLGGLDLLDLIRDYRIVILVDAIKTRNGIPGTVSYFTPENFTETLHLSNFHDASFLNTLHLGKQLGIPLPDEIHIIAIEIVEDMVFGNSFSPEIASKMDVIYQEVNQLIKDILVPPSQ
ncbi:MAG: hydrogenase maturation protease [Marinifilaceae bacterium]